MAITPQVYTNIEELSNRPKLPLSRGENKTFAGGADAHERIKSLFKKEARHAPPAPPAR